MRCGAAPSGSALDVPIAVVAPARGRGRFTRALPVVTLGVAVTAKPGRPDAIQRAGGDRFDRPRRRRRASAARPAAVVTNPVAKNVLYKVGLRRARPYRISSPSWPFERPASAVHPVMMLWSPELAVVPVTIHLPLKEVPQRSRAI